MSSAEDFPSPPLGKVPRIEKPRKKYARNNLDQDDRIDKIRMTTLLTVSINIKAQPSKADYLFRLQYRPE